MYPLSPAAIHRTSLSPALSSNKDFHTHVMSLHGLLRRRVRAMTVFIGHVLLSSRHLSTIDHHPRSRHRCQCPFSNSNNRNGMVRAEQLRFFGLVTARIETTTTAGFTTIQQPPSALFILAFLRRETCAIFLAAPTLQLQTKWAKSILTGYPHLRLIAFLVRRKVLVQRGFQERQCGGRIQHPCPAGKCVKQFHGVFGLVHRSIV